MAIGGNMLTIR